MSITTMQIIVDEKAEKSLQLILALNAVSETSNEGDGAYKVKGERKRIERIADYYPEVVMKLEEV